MTPDFLATWDLAQAVKWTFITGLLVAIAWMYAERVIRSPAWRTAVIVAGVAVVFFAAGVVTQAEITAP